MKFRFVFIFWLIFLALYLLGTTKFPIFEDEAEYLLLAERITTNPTGNFFIYLQNGLLPFYGFLVAVLTKVLGDSLVSGRVLNILLASSLVFWVNSVTKLFKLPSFFALSTISFLIASPILILNTRVVLLDIPVLVFIAWYIYLTAKLINQPNRKPLLFLSLLFLVLLAAFLTKATSLFGLPATLFLIFSSIKNEKKVKLIHLKIFSVYFGALLVSGLVFISFAGQIGADSGSSLITNLTLDELFPKIKLNLWLTFIWAKVYYWPYFFVLLAPLLIILYKPEKKTRQFFWAMIIWILTSLITMILFNRFYFPRHILVIVVPLIFIATYLMIQLSRFISVIFFLTIFFMQINFSSKIINNPQKTAIALEDRFSYFENYTSGVTIKDISNTLVRFSDKEPITVWLDGSYVLEYGLRREMKDNSNVHFKSFRLGKSFLPHAPESVFKDEERTTFVLVNRWLPPNLGQLKQVKSFTVSFRHGQSLYLVE